MAILITGGCGYIGSHTCLELIQAGYDIAVLDNYCNSKPEVLDRIRELAGRDFPFFPCDIRDEKALRAVFDAVPVQAVIHFAGLKAVGESVREPLTYYDNNVGGTVTLCRVMQQAGCRCIVFSSSATVYNKEDPSPLREEMPVGRVENPYGRTKYIIETLLQDLCAADPAWSAMLLRYFNPIGAHESGRIGEDPAGIPNNLMPYISQVAVGRLAELPVFGNDYDTPDGTGVRDYIHVVDLAKGHVAAVKRAETVKGCEIYNLGTGVGVSVLELVHAFESATGVKIPYVIAPRRPGDIDASFADVTKANTVLGWKANLTAFDACRDTWNWQKKNPNGYDD